jgi:hypothetical protein
MPRYDFLCEDCEGVRGVLTSYERSSALELICTDCGGIMRVAPVLSVNIGGFFAESVEGRNDNKGAAALKGCGHSYACRCGGVKLTKPNPFKERLGNGGGNPNDR